MTAARKILRRILARAIRWATVPDRIPYATRGSDVWIVEPFSVNLPEKLFLGSNLYIGPYAAFNTYGGIRIADGCSFGPFVHIYSANHNYENAECIPYDYCYICKPVDIGPYVWLGGDVTVLPGVTIGEGAVIGAGSVVVKDIPPGAIAGGYPAKPLKFRNMERFQALKASEKILRHMHHMNTMKGSLRDSRGVPTQWYADARLPFPPAARDVPPKAADLSAGR